MLSGEPIADYTYDNGDHGLDHSRNRWQARLVGERVIKAYDHRGSVYLACASTKVLRLSPEGDCCAHAYVQHVNNPESLFDAEVLSVDDLEVTKQMHDAAVAEYRAEHEYDPDVLDIWGHRINTTRGTCVFDCRTSHNGYYSGSFTASLVGSVPVGASLLAER